MRRHIGCWAIAGLLAVRPAGIRAEDSDYLKNLEPYRSSRTVTGTIRNWGNNYIPALMKMWQDGFQKYHPAIRFETSLKSTEAAVAGLYGGIADLAFVGREVYGPESRGFEKLVWISAPGHSDQFRKLQHTAQDICADGVRAQK